MLIVARSYGQLGNRLLTFAHIIAAGIEYGVPVLNPTFHEYARSFPAIADDPLCRFPAMSFGGAARVARSGLAYLTPLADKIIRHGLPDGRLRNTVMMNQFVDCNMSSERFRTLVETKRRLLLFGYRFHHPAIDKHRETIRHFFRPDPYVLQRALDTVTAARGAADLLVGVHIRRGDYREWRGGRYYYSYAQYASLIEQLQSTFEGARLSFLICSDEPIPTAPFNGMRVSIGNGGLVEDLYSLAHCDWLIGPPSSFTTWASFYGDAPNYQVEDADAPVDIDRFRSMRDLPYLGIQEEGFYQGERWA